MSSALTGRECLLVSTQPKPRVPLRLPWAVRYNWAFSLPSSANNPRDPCANHITHRTSLSVKIYESFFPHGSRGSHRFSSHAEGKRVRAFLTSKRIRGRKRLRGQEPCGWIMSHTDLADSTDLPCRWMMPPTDCTDDTDFCHADASVRSVRSVCQILLCASLSVEIGFINVKIRIKHHMDYDMRTTD